jgi:hypothetical protein
MAKIKISNYVGEFPTLPRIGRERSANVYDETVASMAVGDQRKITIVNDTADDWSELLKTHAKLIRNAAEYVGRGVDIRYVGDAGSEEILFRLREKRERKTKEAPIEDRKVAV